MKKVVRKSKTAKQALSHSETHRLIAELVLGWRLHTHRATSGIFSRNNQSTLDVWKDKNGDDVALVADWSPTTNIVDAWRVVDKLQEQFWLELKSPFNRGEKWTAGFTPRGTSGSNGTPDFSAAGETAPLAICRAALAIFADYECFQPTELTEQK